MRIKHERHKELAGHVDLVLHVRVDRASGAVLVSDDAENKKVMR
jgi:hypothetical protein